MHGAAQKDSLALHALEGHSFALSAGLPEPGFDGQPPKPAHAGPGKRGRSFPDHCCAGGETRGPLRHTTAAGNPTKRALAV
jgi:hypothetical protein